MYVYKLHLQKELNTKHFFSIRTRLKKFFFLTNCKLMTVIEWQKNNKNCTNSKASDMFIWVCNYLSYKSARQRRSVKNIEILFLISNIFFMYKGRYAYISTINIIYINIYIHVCSYIYMQMHTIGNKMCIELTTHC